MASRLANIKKFKKSIGMKLMAYIVGTAALVSIAATALQMRKEYQDYIRKTAEQLEYIENSHAPGIAESLRTYDTEQVRIMLEGLVHLPGIEYSEVLGADGKPLASAGAVSSEDETMSRSIPLFHALNGEDVRVGTLKLTASLAGAYELMWDHIATTALTESAKAIILSSLVFLIFHALVTRHLIKMARYTRDMDMDIGFRPLELEGREIGGAGADEIDEVAAAINSTFGRMKLYNDQLTKANEDLENEIAGRRLTEKMLEASLGEKEVLLKEIHHRVKNNMAIVSSLLYLQSRHLNDEGVRNLFNESRNRINSLALVHEKLYQSEDLSNIDIRDYIETLLGNIYSSYRPESGEIALRTEIDDLSMDIEKLIPCGLILNELITNSMKHAFGHGGGGEILVAFRVDHAELATLTVSDNGTGLPAGQDIGKPETLGLTLVNSLAKQLGGEVSYSMTGGLSVSITFNFR